MKKILVVYYSLHGNTGKVASLISKSLNADVEEIIDKKDRSGIVNWFVSDTNEELRTSTKIKSFVKNPPDYDLVIIGTPIWSGMAPAVREYLKLNKSKFKKVAFFSTFGASTEDVFYQMEEAIHKKPLTTLEVQDRQIRIKEYKEKVKKFCNEIKRRI